MTDRLALVLRSGAIGDFVLTLPAIAAFKTLVAPARLRLVGRPSTAVFAPADEVVDVDGAAVAPLFAPTGSKVALLEGDIGWVLAYSVDRRGTLEESLRRRLPKAELVVWDPRPPAGSGRHITDHLLAPLARWSVAAADPRPRIVPPLPARQQADQLWRRSGLSGAVVALHPGSGGRDKCWPLDRFVRLAEGLRRAGYEVLVPLGPVEAEWSAALRQSGACRVVEPADLAGLAALLERAVLFVGNDSGPGHIAAAVGTPTLSLFGPTDPRVWRPRQSRGRVLRAPGGEMALLSAETVAAAALDFLQELSRRPGGRTRPAAAADLEG